MPGVIALAQVGASLRVLAAAETGIEQRLAAQLRDAGVAAEVGAGVPNLEDVFVAATRKPTEEPR